MAMDGSRFDAFTKALAGVANRRRFFRGVGGVAGASAIAATGLTRPARAMAQTDDPEEQAVLLYEELAELTHGHVGSCVELREKVCEFWAVNGDLIAQMKADQDAWTLTDRHTHAQTYGDRRHDATAKIHAAALRCQFAADADATPAVTDGTPTIESICGFAARTPTSAPAAKRAMPGPAWAAARALPGNQHCPYWRTATAECSNEVTKRTSPTFPLTTNCTDDTMQSCDFPCNSNDFCAQFYPDLCVSNGVNNCVLAHVIPSPPDCCHQNCPISTADCVVSNGTYVVTGRGCDACMGSWCGSTDRCLSQCESEECCDGACSEVGEVPHGH
jgi:hypothetical protein